MIEITIISSISVKPLFAVFLAKGIRELIDNVRYGDQLIAAPNVEPRAVIALFHFVDMFTDRHRRADHAMARVEAEDDGENCARGYVAGDREPGKRVEEIGGADGDQAILRIHQIDGDHELEIDPEDDPAHHAEEEGDEIIRPLQLDFWLKQIISPGAADFAVGFHASVSKINSVSFSL